MFYAHNIGTYWKEGHSCVTISFDCETRKDVEVLPELLDILSSYDMILAFACIGKFIEKYPKIHLSIVEGKHEILNHTYTHPDHDELNPKQKFSEMTEGERKSEIMKCNDVCKNVLGYSPRGFRTPHFGKYHIQDVYDVLGEIGYGYSSSTVATFTPKFGRPFTVHGLNEFPVSTCPKHPYSVLDSWHCIGAPDALHREEGEFYHLMKTIFTIGIRTNSYINLYFDPRDVAKLNDFRRLLDYLDEKTKEKELWLATYNEIDSWLREKTKRRETY